MLQDLCVVCVCWEGGGASLLMWWMQLGDFVVFGHFGDIRTTHSCVVCVRVLFPWNLRKMPSSLLDISAKCLCGAFSGNTP